MLQSVAQQVPVTIQCCRSRPKVASRVRVIYRVVHMKQWHPVLARMLRPAVGAYYDIQTTLPVGDSPREADFVLLRRTGQAPPPFRGLWRHLTIWNILEFKGPTVSPRLGDIDLLIELGLGIDRRLRERRAQGQRRVIP